MDMRGLPDDWADKLTQRSQRFGSGIDLAELFYMGERASAKEYLAGHGWQVAVQTTEEAYAANGFEVPDDELAAFGGDSGYLSATLR
jgi:O-methyltransferase involved in polyketide biosynthesis